MDAATVADIQGVLTFYPTPWRVIPSHQLHGWAIKDADDRFIPGWTGMSRPWARLVVTAVNALALTDYASTEAAG